MRSCPGQQNKKILNISLAPPWVCPISVNSQAYFFMFYTLKVCTILMKGTIFTKFSNERDIESYIDATSGM